MPPSHADYPKLWGSLINPLLVFSVATSASEVIFAGRSSAEDGTVMSNLPMTVRGGTGAPRLVLQALRIINNNNTPAIIVTDEADLVVINCAFESNPGSAIRQLSGRLQVRSSLFKGNGNNRVSGGAFQLLGGVSEILSSTLENNLALTGAAVYVFAAVLSLGERTLLRNNLAVLDGNSVSVANGTVNYLLPAPLGHWVGPVRQDGYTTNTSWINYGGAPPLLRDGYSTTTHAIHIFDDRAKTSYFDPEFPAAPYPPRLIELTQLAHIDDDFPYPCEPGYYRSNDLVDFQVGPTCEAICPAGYYCPLGTPYPLSCFNASYCPTGSPWPISCPPGTYTHNNSLTNSSECTPCDAGHFCPHNNSEPIPCPKGHIAPVEGYSKCEPCPVGYYAEELAQTQCIKCVEGVYCSLGTTIRPCDPGWFRNLTDSGCVPAYLGMYAAKGATEPTDCSAGSFANKTGTPECPLCPAGKYQPARGQPQCELCPVGGYCLEGATSPTPCSSGTVRVTVGAASQLDCVPSFAGTFSVGGLPENCPISTFAPKTGGRSAGDCTNCPENSITLNTGEVDQSACICQNGFIQIMDDSGLMSCICKAGDGLENVACTYFCRPCAIGAYKPFRGNDRCTECDGSPGAATGGWTTMYEGSTLATDCICNEGRYLAPTVRENFCDEAPGQLSPFAFRGRGVRRGEEGQSTPEDEARECWRIEGGQAASPVARRASTQSATRKLWLDTRDDADSSTEYFRNFDCYYCDEMIDTTAPAGEDGEIVLQHNCTYKGVELHNVPIAHDYMRTTNVSHQIRWCGTNQGFAGNCKGGTNVSDSCHDSQDGTKGPYCRACATTPVRHYSAGKDSRCKACEGDEGLTIILFAVIPPVVLILLCICSSQIGKLKKRLLTDRLPMTCEILAGEDPEDVWAMQLEKATEQLGEDYPRTFGVVNWVGRHAKTFGPRMKILISLFQVMNGVGSVFTFVFPPIFSFVINIFFFPINLDLPNWMPLQCFIDIDYYGTLVQKTAVPFGIVALMFMLSAIASKFCSAKDSDDWDTDADGVIDKNEFMSAQPAGKFISELCSSIAFFLMFFFYPSASVAAFLYMSCFPLDFPGESKLEYLIADPQVDCRSDKYNTWFAAYDIQMIWLIGFGVPIIYGCMLYTNRVDLDRLRRFQIEAEDMQEESKARKMTLSELTIDEFERAELMRLLEEAEVERIEKKRFHLFRTLPASLKKLTAGYTSKCFWFEIFECVRKLAIIGIPAIPVFKPGGVEQRSGAMLICFMSFGVISHFEPYEDPEDTRLALMCQFEIFVMMVASMVTSVSKDTALVDAALTIILTAIVLFALATEGELLDGWGEYLGVGEDEDVDTRPKVASRGDIVKRTIQKVFHTIVKGVNFLLGLIDKIGGVQDQEQLRQEVRRKRAENHPELGRRHRISSWKKSATFEESKFAGVEAEVAEEGGTRSDMLDRLTQRDREDSDDDDQEMARVPKGAKGLVKVDVKTFLNPESAGIKLSLGDLTQSAREASSKTAKSLATLVRAIKQCMEASLASQADNWPLMTPRGQHLTEVYKSEVTYEEAVSQLNNSTKEIFEAYHELRGISFLAGGSAGDVQKNVQGLGRPQNAQEWKLLVATCAQATMSIAKSLRVLKQGLVRLPSDAADIDITGMRASQLEGEFGGVMQEVGVAANSTVLTLRELLSNAVDAGADPRFAPWRQADQETTLEALDAAQKSQLEADSGRGNTRRVSIEERLAAARRKSAEVTRPNLQFPEMLPKPRPLPQYGHPPDAYVDQMSTPNKLSKPNEDDNSDPEDYQPESSKGSPDSTRKMRRAQPQEIGSRLISLLTSHLLLGPEVASVPTHLLHSPERCSTWAAENRKWWPRIPRTPLHRCSAGTLHLDH